MQLARQLHASGRCQVHLAVLDGNGTLRAEAEQIGLPDIPSFPLTGFTDRNTAIQLRHFVRFLRTRAIDIVHTHDFYTNIFGMTGASLAGVTGRVASRRESSVRKWNQRFVERMAYRVSHAVVANCEAVRQQLIAEGVSGSKVVTIYNGLDTGRVRLPASFNREDAQAALNLPRKGSYPVVSILANLRIDLKDHPTFIRAASRVIRAVPETRFILAGEGELSSSLRKLANELGLGQSALFTGRCERVPELLALSDVCVLSSKAEGFSNSILEYMAAARPVVATDVGGAREAVIEGETGFLVRSGDDEALADRIITLLRDPARARTMGELGRRVVEEKFSSAAQLNKTHQLYDRLLKGERAQERLSEDLSREGI